jgi:hypothetical protein
MKCCCDVEGCRRRRVACNFPCLVITDCHRDVESENNRAEKGAKDIFITMLRMNDDEDDDIDDDDDDGMKKVKKS